MIKQIINIAENKQIFWSAIKPLFQSRYFRRVNKCILNGSVVSITASIDRDWGRIGAIGKGGLGGTFREMRERHAIAGSRSPRKWPRHRNEGDTARPEARGERINATRYTEEGNPGNAFANQSSSPGARISSKESSVFPPLPSTTTHPALPSTPYLFFLIFSSSAFVWSSSTRYPRPTLPLFTLSPLWDRRRVASSRKRKDGGGGGKGEEGNAVTRENPLRNVFGPCTVQYHLQSRACVKYTCKKRKKRRRGRIIDVQPREFRKCSLYRNATKAENAERERERKRLIFKFDLIRSLAYFFPLLNMYTVRCLSRADKFARKERRGLL